jgi:hypothetical protein
MEASTLIGAVGAFFAKKGEKTFLEDCSDDIRKICAATGDSAPRAAAKKDKENDSLAAFNGLLAQVQRHGGLFKNKSH